jgi:hypothetical protein
VWIRVGLGSLSSTLVVLPYFALPSHTPLLRGPVLQPAFTTDACPRSEHAFDDLDSLAQFVPDATMRMMSVELIRGTLSKQPYGVRDIASFDRLHLMLLQGLKEAHSHPTEELEHLPKLEGITLSRSFIAHAALEHPVPPVNGHVQLDEMLQKGVDCFEDKSMTISDFFYCESIENCYFKEN